MPENNQMLWDMFVSQNSNGAVNASYDILASF